MLSRPDPQPMGASAPTPRGVLGILALDKHRDILRQMFAPVSEALIDDAEIAPGQSVLDVATGRESPRCGSRKLWAPTERSSASIPPPRRLRRHEARPN